MSNALTRVLLPTHRTARPVSFDAWRHAGWIALPWLLPITCALLWVLGSRYGWISAQALLPPALVFDTLSSLAHSGELGCI